MIVPVGPFGVSLRDDDDRIVGAINQGKAWEAETRKWWASRAINTDSVVIDVGCYTGIYAIAAALAGRAVMAFEPHPPNVSRILDNVDVNCVRGRVAVLEVALSSFDGLHPMTVKQGINDVGVLSDDGNTMVQTMRLDTMNLRDVGLIKIDVEGHEVEVLDSMRETLRRSKPDLIVEVLNDTARVAVETELADLYYAGPMLDHRNLVLYPR